MAAPLSNDLKIRDVNEVRQGRTVRDVALQYTVSVASVVRWYHLYR